MTYENAYEYYTKLMTKVESQEGYTKSTPVAFIGYHHMDSMYRALNIYIWQQFLLFYLAPT